MAGLEDWLAVARSGDADELRERILTDDVRRSARSGHFEMLLRARPT